MKRSQSAWHKPLQHNSSQKTLWADSSGAIPSASSSGLGLGMNQVQVQVLAPSMHIPSIKIASDIVHEVVRQGAAKANKGMEKDGLLIGFVEKENRLNVEEVAWNRNRNSNRNRNGMSNKKIEENHDQFLNGDCRFPIKFGEGVGNEEFERIYEKIQHKLTKGIGTSRMKHKLGPYDLCSMISNYHPSTSTPSHITLTHSFVYPDISLSLRPIPAIKIVSTSLSRKLVKKTSQNFSSGFLTMDQAHRLLPLSANDPLLQKYPLVGIWVAGGNSKGVGQSQALASNLNMRASTHASYKQLNANNSGIKIKEPEVWAACVRYLETRAIPRRLSNDLSTSSFLMIKFERNVKYLQVGIDNPENAGWRFISYSQKIAAEGPFPNIRINFAMDKDKDMLKEGGKASPSPDSTLEMFASNLSLNPTLSSVSSSSTCSPSALIREQSLSLRSLQDQLLELQVLSIQNYLISRERNGTHGNANTGNYDHHYPMRHDLVRIPEYLEEESATRQMHELISPIRSHSARDWRVSLGQDRYRDSEESEEFYMRDSFCS